MAQFTTDIRHVSGAGKIPADALSRVDAVTAPIDYMALAATQAEDKELSQLLRDSNSLRLEFVRTSNADTPVYCDTSLGKPRPYVPAGLRRQVFDMFHGLSHPGTRSTVRLIADRFIWPGLRKDCRTWARSCLPCQRSKISRHVVTPTGTIQVPA